jgi:hypothetical protein
LRKGWPGFLVDILVGAVLMAVISGGGFVLVLLLVFLGSDIGAFGLTWPAILLGPVIVLFLGLGKQRFGMAASALLVTVVPALGLFAAEYFSVWQIRSQEQRDVAAPSKPLDAVVLVWEAGYGCGPACMHILLQAPYDVVIPRSDVDPYGSARRFHKVEGEACYGTDAIRSLAAFAEQRVVGICDVMTPVTSVGDGLVFRDDQGRGLLTLAFKSLVYVRTFSAIERIDGRERVLGRWMQGRTNGLFSFDVNPELERRQIYEAVLHQPFDLDAPAGKARRAEIIAWLRPAMRAPEVPPALIQHYSGLLDWYARAHPDEAEPLIRELIASGNPELHKAGVALLPENLGNRNPLMLPEDPFSQ